MAETRMEVDSMDTALAVFGSCDENIRLLEQSLGVTAVCRGTELKFSGPEDAVQKARRAVDAMLALREGGTPLEEQTVRYCISLADAGEEEKVQELAEDFHSGTIGYLSRSELVMAAEEQKKTLMECYPDSEMADEYRALSEAVLAICKN